MEKTLSTEERMTKNNDRWRIAVNAAHRSAQRVFSW